MLRRVGPAAGLLRAEASLRLLELFAPQPALVGLAPPDAAADDDEAAPENDAVWFAVPKSRISKSKKRIKNANAGPKPRAFEVCACCGKPKLRHHMWKSCVEAAARDVAEKKAAAAAASDGDADVAAPR